MRLHPPLTESTDSISVNSPQTQEALAILNTVALQHGFHSVDNQEGYIRVYLFDEPPVTIEGNVHRPTIPCRVGLTPTGLRVTFGEYGFVAYAPEEELSLFNDVRATFIHKYGKRNVKSHEWGHP